MMRALSSQTIKQFSPRNTWVEGGAMQLERGRGHPRTKNFQPRLLIRCQPIRGVNGHSGGTVSINNTLPAAHNDKRPPSNHHDKTPRCPADPGHHNREHGPQQQEPRRSRRTGSLEFHDACPRLESECPKRQSPYDLPGCRGQVCHSASSLFEHLLTY